MTIGPFQNQAHRRDAPAYRQAPIKRENAKVERQEKNLISLRSLHSLRLCGADLIWTRMVFGIFANYVTLDRVPSCVYFFIAK